MSDAWMPKLGGMYDSLMRRLMLRRLLLRMLSLYVFQAFVSCLLGFPSMPGDVQHVDGFTLLNLPFFSLKILAVQLLGAWWIAIEIREQMENGKLDARVGRGEPAWKILRDILSPAIMPFLMAVVLGLVVWLPFRLIPGNIRAWNGGELTAADQRWISLARAFAMPGAMFAWLGLHALGLLGGGVVALRRRRPWFAVPAGGTITLTFGLFLLCLTAWVNTAVDDDLRRNAVYVAKEMNLVKLGVIVSCLAAAVVFRTVAAGCHFSAFAYSVALFGANDFMLVSRCDISSPISQLFEWKVLYPFLIRRAVIYYGIVDALLIIGIAGAILWLKQHRIKWNVVPSTDS